MNKGDQLPAFFLKKLQDFLQGLTPNLVVTCPTTTSIRLPGSADPMAAVVGGLFRYITADWDTTHPGGGAGVYDIHVVASAETVVNTPAPFTDNTDYNFYPKIVVSGGTPSGSTPGGNAITQTRKIGECDWDGSKITGLRLINSAKSGLQAIQPMAANAEAWAVSARGATSHDVAVPILRVESVNAGTQYFTVQPNLTKVWNALTVVGTLNAGTIAATDFSGTWAGETKAQVVAGNTPKAHHASHEPSGSDPMAVDAVTGTGSLRTLGTGAQQAAAGSHAAQHRVGGADPLHALPSQIWGDGSDGAITFDGTTTILGSVPSGGVYTLQRNIYGTTVVVNTGVTIQTAGYIIFGSQSITLNGTAKVANDGSDGVVPAGGVCGGSVRWSSQIFGGLGSKTTGANADLPSVMLGRKGGNGGTGPSGSGGTSAEAAPGANGGTSGVGGVGGIPHDAAPILAGVMFGGATFGAVFGGAGGGGGGGDGTSFGGGGGGGGGVVVLVTPVLTGGASSSLSAKGGAGAAATAGNTGGGGGGGGGAIYLIVGINSFTGTTVLIAGSGGAGHGTGTNGGVGIAGAVFVTIIV